jgi:hypothetical protein
MSLIVGNFSEPGPCRVSDPCSEMGTNPSPRALAVMGMGQFHSSGEHSIQPNPDRDSPVAIPSRESFTDP